MIDWAGTRGKQLGAGDRLRAGRDLPSAAERWAISFNLADRTVTGNVFRTDGSAPSFIWCRITSSSHLFLKILGEEEGERMPLGGPYLDEAQEAAIRSWILDGAADN